MNQIIRRRFQTLLFVGLTMSFPAVAASVLSDGAENRDSAEAAKETSSRPGHAMTVSVDAETGELRAPTAEELKAQSQRVTRIRRSKLDDYEIKVYADGLIALKPRRSALRPLVAVVDSEGKVSLRHGAFAEDDKPEDCQDSDKHEHH